MKRWTCVLSVIAFLLLSTTLAPPVPAADSPGTAAAQPGIESPADEEQIYTQLLPIVFRTQRNPRSCPIDSPFSLQIAALHQVTAALDGAGPDAQVTDAEWMAWYDQSFPTLVDALMDSGACWTRLRIDWALIQPDAPPAAYVWGPYHDEKLALVAESGVHIIAHVDNVPDWAGVSAAGPIHQDRLADMSQFLTDLVNRYKQPPYNIHHWELFNEPDWTSEYGTLGWGKAGGQYAQMLAVARAAIKAADPGATVLMGGIAYDWFIEYGGPFNRYFSDDVMAAGGGQFLDVLNFHYFPDYALEWERWNHASIPPTCGDVEDGAGAAYSAAGIDVIAKANHFRNRMQTCYGTSLPVWLTELGEHGYMGDAATLEQQARYVIQGYARALAAGMRNVTWHALVDPPYYPYEQGLLDSTFAPKPAFYSYQTLTRELEGHTYSYALDAQGVEGYVFVDGTGRSKIVAWTWGPASQSAYLTIPGTSQVRRVDRNRVETYVVDGGAGDVDGTVNGSIRVQLPPPPVDPNTSDSYRFTAEPLFLSP